MGKIQPKFERGDIVYFIKSFDDTYKGTPQLYTGIIKNVEHFNNETVYYSIINYDQHLCETRLFKSMQDITEYLTGRIKKL